MSRYEFIDSQKTEPTNRNPVVKMCHWLDVSTSGFYHWRTRPQSATVARRETLLARIRHYFEESDGTYGYRRIHADLTAEQTQCSPELVRQLMRQEGLVACQPRPFRVTTEANALAAANMPDLLTRDFTADRPGVKFVGDITYIHTWQGFIYRAVRKVLEGSPLSHRFGREGSLAYVERLGSQEFLRRKGPMFRVMGFFSELLKFVAKVLPLSLLPIIDMSGVVGTTHTSKELTNRVTRLSA